MRQEPRPRRPLHAVLLACGVVPVLFVAGLAANRYGADREPAAAVTASPKPTSKQAPARARAPGIGDPVRDGKFEFVVSRVDCSRTSIGIEHLKRTAKGRFCMVSLSVHNISGNDSQYLLGHAQKLVDVAGTAYGNDEVAGLYVNRNTTTFLQKLKPGDRVAGRLVFDVPKKVKPAVLELHDSLLSRGVKITVS
jgi:hypothetical protein